MGKVDGKIKTTTISMQSFIGNPNSTPNVCVDHIDNNALNNRKSNYRVTTDLYNLKNRKGRNRNNKSGYRNVCLVNNKWIVQLMVNGKNKCYGRFKNIEDAVNLAEELRNKYFGDFAGKG